MSVIFNRSIQENELAKAFIVTKSFHIFFLEAANIEIIYKKQKKIRNLNVLV
jgi:hypothetical protein